MSELTLSYSLADQNFGRTKSLGILNLSVQLGEALGRSAQFRRFTVFSNSQLASEPSLSPFDTRRFDHAADSGLGRVRWDQWQCYSAARRSGNDWLFLPKGFASFVRKPPVRLAAYVHDVMHDFYAVRFPGSTPALEQSYFQKAFIATLRHADIIFTNTEFTRAEVMRMARQVGLVPPRTDVAGIGFVAGPASLGSAKSSRILLLVGRAPHKRTDLAISWMRQWLEASKFEGEIHLVGSLPDAVKIPGGKQWHHHVRPQNTDYQALLSSVCVAVYISEYEGFGMPPVEAAIAGACPVFSDLPPTREVMREAGLPFSNDSFASFCSALDRGIKVSPETVANWRDELLARHSWGLVVDRVVSGLREMSSVSTRPMMPSHPVAIGAPRRHVIHIGGAKRALAWFLGRMAVALRAWRRSGGGTTARSVLIVEPFGMGDVILHEPMVRALRQNGFDVTFCGRAEWRHLFPSIKWVDSRIAWGQHQKARKYLFGSYLNPAFRRFFRDLRHAGRQSRLGIDTRGDIRSVVLLYAAGCREVISVSRYLGTDLELPRSVGTLVEYSPSLRRWELNLRCLTPLGLDPRDASAPRLQSPARTEARLPHRIGLMPVAPWPGKWWQPGKWANVVSALRERGHEVTALCGPNQRALTSAQLSCEMPIDECGSVSEWSHQLAQLDLLVTLDSGPMHLAEAMGTPVVALFGQGLLPLWAPSHPHSELVTHQEDPDFKVCLPSEANTARGQEFMRRISAEEVLGAIARVLARLG